MASVSAIAHTNTMPAGKLDQRITILQPTAAKNDVGEDVLTYATWAEVWAGIRALPQRQREKYAGAKDVAETWLEVTVRRMQGLQANMRIDWESYVYGNVTLDIRGIEESRDRGAYILLMCRMLQ